MAVMALSATAFVSSPAVAQSDRNPATSNLLTGGLVIPYEGVLVLDSGPVNGNIRIRFELWDDPVATGANRRLWQEEQDVAIFNGRFSVALGAGAQLPNSRALTEVVQDGERLYLAILVRDDTNTFVRLSGRQSIEPVPYAAWSASSANFDVGGDLTVGGRATIGSGSNTVRIDNGTITAQGTIESGTMSSLGNLQCGGSISATGDITSGGNISTTQDMSAGGTLSSGGDLSIGGDRLDIGANRNFGTALSATINDQLLINGDGDYANGTVVNGGLAAGDLTFFGNFRGWTTSSVRRNSNGSSDLGVVATDGICFLTEVRVDHTGADPGPQRCLVEINVSNRYQLTVQEGGGAQADTDCAARCLVF